MKNRVSQHTQRCLICEKLPRKRHTKTRSPERTQTLRSSRDLMHLRVLSHHDVYIASGSNPGQFAPNNMDHALRERCTRSFGDTAVHVETAAQTMFFRSASLHHVSESCSKNRRHTIDTTRFDTLKTPTTTDPDLFPCLWTISVCRVPAESTFVDVFFFFFDWHLVLLRGLLRGGLWCGSQVPRTTRLKDVQRKELIHVYLLGCPSHVLDRATLGAVTFFFMPKQLESSEANTRST